LFQRALAADQTFFSSRFYKTYNKISIFITRNRKPVDYRLLQRIQLEVLSRELNITLPGYVLITAQNDIANFVSLRRSFKLNVNGFIKRVHVMSFINALNSLWTSTLPGNVISVYLLINRLRVGHTRLLLKGENQPVCGACYSPLTVKHILVDCTRYSAACQRYFGVDTLEDVFENVASRNIITCVKDIGFYNRI